MEEYWQLQEKTEFGWKIVCDYNELAWAKDILDKQNSLELKKHPSNRRKYRLVYVKSEEVK